MMRHTHLHLPTTLRFVESDDHFSVYVDRDGEEVYLAHGTAQRLMLSSDLWGKLTTLWRQYQAGTLPGQSHDPCRHGHDEFVTLMRALTIDDEIEDWIGWCLDCGGPHHEDDLHDVAGGEACEPCRDSNFSTCDQCDTYFQHENLTRTLGDDDVCRPCLENYWSWCDNCDGWRHDGDYHDHQHDCGCEAPAQTFWVRNGDGPALRNDTRARISLGGDSISDEGLNAICYYLRHQSAEAAMPSLDPSVSHVMVMVQLVGHVESLGAQWQTRQGNYPKRLSRLAYKRFNLKLSPETLSQVGNIARAHSRPIDFDIEVTRDLNMSAEEFANDGSCWWPGGEVDHVSSRCALKNNGGFGLRTFTEVKTGTYDWPRVEGRAWVLPLRVDLRGDLSPTFEPRCAEAFVVFNGYGDLDGFSGARLIAHMAKMSYSKITFRCGPMYINGDFGYLVASEEILAEHDRVSLNLDPHSNLFHTEAALPEVLHEATHSKELAHA